MQSLILKAAQDFFFFFILTLGLSLKRNIHIIRRQAQTYSAVRSFEHKATGQAIGQRIERIGVL